MPRYRNDDIQRIDDLAPYRTRAFPSVWRLLRILPGPDGGEMENCGEYPTMGDCYRYMALMKKQWHALDIFDKLGGKPYYGECEGGFKSLFLPVRTKGDPTKREYVQYCAVPLKGKHKNQEIEEYLKQKRMQERLDR